MWWFRFFDSFPSTILILLKITINSQIVILRFINEKMFYIFFITKIIPGLTKIYEWKWFFRISVRKYEKNTREYPLLRSSMIFSIFFPIRGAVRGLYCLDLRLDFVRVINNRRINYTANQVKSESNNELRSACILWPGTFTENGRDRPFVPGGWCLVFGIVNL